MQDSRQTLTGPVPGRLVLVCGLPGAGKTTLARQLEAAMPAVRLCPDEWLADLGVDLWDQAVRDRLERTLWGLAQRLLALGTSVVLEYGFWARWERDEKRLDARALGVQVELHYLEVSLEERWRRIERRNGDGTWPAAPITREQLAGWDVLFEAPDAAELALFDPPTRLVDGGRARPPRSAI